MAVRSRPYPCAVILFRMELSECDAFVASTMLVQLKQEARENRHKPPLRQATKRRKVPRVHKNSVPSTPCCSPTDDKLSAYIYGYDLEKDIVICEK